LDLIVEGDNRDESNADPSARISTPDIGEFRMIRRNLLLGFAALAFLAMTPQVEAGYSTISFNDLGNPTINGTTIATSTVFTIGDLKSKTPTAYPNLFNGTPVTDFGQLSFSLTNPTAFTFGNAAFGTFTATSITPYNYSNTGDGESEFFYFSGNFLPGTSNSNPSTGLGPMSIPASFTCEFSLSSANGLGDGSFALSVPPAPGPVAEPASIAMLGIGLLAVGGVTLRRRRLASKLNSSLPA
jgi:hypothetical protein